MLVFKDTLPESYTSIIRMALSWTKITFLKKMNKLNFDNMSRDELAHYVCAHRDTPDGIEARRVYIRRMAEKAKKRGIKFDRPELHRQFIDKSNS